MKKYWKWYFLPSPKDLGWSEHNALKMDCFSPYQEGKSWEDWHRYVKEKYPFRYFLAHTVRDFFAHRIYRFKRQIEMIKDRFFDRRHLLDLSRVSRLEGEPPCYGYTDPCYRFYLAGWACLEAWIAEGPRNPHLDKNEFDDTLYTGMYDEAMALHHYWTVTRQERELESVRLHRISESIDPTPENREQWEKAKDEWVAYFQRTERIEQEMFMRLAAIREFLWT